MDPLTHTLTGLALSRAGLKRCCPYATWVVVLAAIVPDVEVASVLWGETAYLHWHRHITHALLMMPVMALAAVLLVRLAVRKPLDWPRAYAVSLIGLASHLLLDWTNAYGVRFLLPFSGQWFRLDITAVIDFWIWAVLLLAVLGPALSRLVSSEIGARPGSGRGLAVLALLLLVCYQSGRYVLHQRAVAVLDSRLYDGSVPTRVAAFPGSWNPFRWRGLAETQGSYSIHEVDLLREFDPSRGLVLYKPEPDPAQSAAWNAAAQTPAFQAFSQFSQYPLRRFIPSEVPEQGMRVEVMDLRYGSPLSPQFVATAIVDAEGRVGESGFSFSPRFR